MFHIGLDIGQARDHAALALVQRFDKREYGANPVLHCLQVRYLKRIELGTPFGRIVNLVRQVTQHHEVRGQCTLTVDAGGMGAPVVEMLRDAQLGCDLSAVTISGGDREHHNGSYAGVTKWSVPKQDLMGALQLMLEREELKVARDLRDAGSLVQELLDMRTTLRESGRERMGADGYGEHDDLVIAVALSIWRARRRNNSFGTQRLPGI